ncbi:oligo-beta-mannoside permease IIC protein [Bacillus glycinifermentans]|uniref:Permease IIC component n=1 Tax=Bacillus glycinifermentans TaxID=1664069 RepID=A0A0J6EHA3_9BACI|nr:PTS cellobiose transporter subunit IIC [Bacillus glycinifermentans]ATH93701.1 PTS system, cellobiose-specific IIC component [Bacillus glycinifermentans]KMM56710.1 oligo-beta-mannoside permease IIC protein [Bacillus glycinifermentans]KRT90124.1 oligo-beta-mannoside permease IIC protein [Bacillus glycinifermentans]MEC0483807.1 PTS cellobiose transporter subunit IIC [Bacillus glycinifermentans]MEC0496301.1 PTS cellobiose transporter subunit IIC [Bacillus glycinifermentans]
MNKFNLFLEEKVMPIAGRIAAQRHLQALRDGIILTMPLIIIGSLFLILANLPIPGYAEFMAGIFGDKWAEKLSYPVGVSFDIMALIATFGIAYRLAEKYGIDALSSGAIAVAAFLLATPYQIPFTPEGSTQEILVTGGIPISLMGSKGLFVGMLIAMFSTEIYRWIVQKDIVVKMPDGVPPAVSKSFIALIPGFAVIGLIWLARLLIEITPFESLHNVINVLLGTPLSILGGSLGGSLVAETVQQLLWSCGLHGANIVGGVMSPIWYGAMDENRLAFQAGEVLPNIFTIQFFEIWINIGGSGATLALVVTMVLRARSKQMKQLGKLAIGPAIFNINEPVIFGMPIVMNPMLLLPFIVSPILMMVATYIGMSTGLVAKPAGIAVPWTMPPLFSGYLATGGKISGAVMQLINLFISFAVYYPFFRMWDKQKLKEESELETVPPANENQQIGV